MSRLTYYDDLAGCYKLKPESNSNVIQRLGQLESDQDNLLQIKDEYEKDIINSSEAWSHVLSMLSE